jgi:hypothetical protein
VVWTVVSVRSAGGADVSGSVTTNRDALIERAICYSTDSTEYNDCIAFRDSLRTVGREPLKFPMLTPFRISLCASLQSRFSGEDFWECVKALADPRR